MTARVVEAGGRGEAAALDKARQLLAAHSFAAAAEAYEQANESTGGKCGECLLGLARARLGIRDVNAAIVAAKEAVGVLAGDPLQAVAYQYVGYLLFMRAAECKPAPCGDAALADLAGAEEAYGKALALGGDDRAQALVGLAMTRFRLLRYDGAVEAAREALTLTGSGPVATRARVLLCRARRAGNLPAPSGSSEIHRISDGIRVGEVSKPVKVSAPPPVYTDDARKNKVTGAVIMEAIIDQEGCVTNAHVLRGLPSGLDQASLTAISEWVFEPARLGGEPVKVYYTLTVNFEVEFKSPPR